MTDYCTLYVTVPDQEVALKISRLLLEERLIACANISDVMTSLYEWDGKICEDSERAMFLKTRKAISDKAINRIKELHPYDIPCIVQWDISDGHQPYLNWLGEQTD